MEPVMAAGIQAGNMKIAQPGIAKKSALMAIAATGRLMVLVRL